MASELKLYATVFVVRNWDIPANLLTSSEAEGRFTHDIVAYLIVQVVQRHRVDLIDIQSFSSGSTSSLATGCVIDHQKIHCLSNQTLPDRLIQDVLLKFTQLGAEISNREIVFNNPSLVASCYSAHWDWNTEGDIHMIMLVDKEAKINSRVPRLSDGPRDGKNQSSWNNALSTRTARAWVTKLGIDVQCIRTIEIAGEKQGDEKQPRHTIGQGACKNYEHYYLK